MISKVLATILMLTLTACGGGGGDGDSSGGGNDNQNLNTGIFIDSEVEGLEYFTSSGIIGITNNKGEFNYKNQDFATFKIGDVVLGSVLAEKIIMPQDLSPLFIV